MTDCSFLVLLGGDLPPAVSERDAALRDTRMVQETLPDLVANRPGVARAACFRLAVPDARGDRGPGTLVALDVRDADAFAAIRDAQPDLFRGGDDRWFLGWERRAGWHGTPTELAAPYVFLVAMDVPAGTSASDLDTFNAFYDDPHIPEVLRIRGFRRGIRYASHWGATRSGNSAPAHLAVYEGDEDAIRAEEHTERYAEFTEPGPPIWQRRTTHWRLVYRRVGGFEPLS